MIKKIQINCNGKSVKLINDNYLLYELKNILIDLDCNSVPDNRDYSRWRSEQRGDTLHLTTGKDVTQ